MKNLQKRIHPHTHSAHGDFLCYRTWRGPTRRPGVCCSYICPFKSTAGEVSGVSSSDRAHLPPGGEDLQEARTPHGRLLPHRPRLHLHGVRGGLAQIPRHRLRRPRVEEEDGELETKKNKNSVM